MPNATVLGHYLTNGSNLDPPLFSLDTTFKFKLLPHFSPLMTKYFSEYLLKLLFVMILSRLLARFTATVINIRNFLTMNILPRSLNHRLGTVPYSTKHRQFSHS